MSAMLYVPRTIDGTAVFGRLGRGLSLAHQALRDWNDARVTRDALCRLTDHELYDIGLSRGDIDGVRR
ncbi:DUF1127 domain-containing protein [Pseudooceanicola aestuarii]|uniref:DUF1127 domain-containing protein n=1 Tax=Pseudooceanicola aestuarii TaxID=2697319 RepID=UPI001EF92CBB|nr:DUF1127 domain-containing protein [Pseudooceanicola aestuarii]